jgi:hypothetical protein
MEWKVSQYDVPRCVSLDFYLDIHLILVYRLLVAVSICDERGLQAQKIQQIQIKKQEMGSK